MSFKNRINAFFGLSLHIIGTVFLARFILDMGTRMIYPFIPQIAAGLDLTLVGFSLLISIRAITGITGPIFGVLSDRYGRRKIMALGFLSQGIGIVGLTIFRQWWAALPMVLFGLGLAAFIPAQQAYISDQVAYQKRGRALATVEFSWGLVGILVLPIIGWMINTFGWRSPFFVISGLSLLGAAIVWFRLPRVEQHSQAGLSWSKVQAVCFRTNVLASVVIAFLIFVAMSSFLALWGIWLTADFGLDEVAVGLVATGIGVTELAGSGLSSLFIDRLGKRRGGGLGILLTAIVFLLLPLTQGQFSFAIAGLIVMGFLFEFTIVSMISLYSEQVREARGTVLSVVLLGASVGVAIGPLMTTNLWEQYGLEVVCGVAAACLVGAFGIMWGFLVETDLIYQP